MGSLPFKGSWCISRGRAGEGGDSLGETGLCGGAEGADIWRAPIGGFRGGRFTPGVVEVIHRRHCASLTQG